MDLCQNEQAVHAVLAQPWVATRRFGACLVLLKGKKADTDWSPTGFRLCFDLSRRLDRLPRSDDPHAVSCLGDVARPVSP